MNVQLATRSSVYLWFTAVLVKPWLLVRSVPAWGVVWSLRALWLTNLIVRILETMATHSLRTNNYPQIETAYRLILRFRADHRSTTFRLAELYLNTARHGQGAEVLKDWLDRFPGDVEAYVRISEAYVLAGDSVAAEEHLERARRLAPDSFEVLLASGLFLRYHGNLEKSSEYFRSALMTQERPGALVLLAETLIDNGEEEEAVRLLERAVQIAPDFDQPYLHLAGCGQHNDPSHPNIVYMKSRLESGDLSPFVQSGFHFALGGSYDKLGMWDEAFAHFKMGNDLSWSWFRTLFNVEEWTEYIDQQINIFDRESLGKVWQGADEQIGSSLIFIVGMPRCGSTLVEQILARHPSVRAVGERNDVTQFITKVSSELNQPYPEWVPGLNAETASALGRRYLERVSTLFEGHARLVCKNLLNYREAGFLATILPGAKVIHCRRSALDTCLSCYCNSLVNCPFTHDLRTLGLVYRQYERLMDHWHSVWTDLILDVKYESLVNDPEPHIRTLLAHCQLPWSEECLTPHRMKRPVCTASAKQVKSAIHARSVERWKKYEQFLGPLVEALNSPERT